MPSSNTLIKLASKFKKLNIETLNIQPKCKFLLRCMKKVKKNKKGYFKYGTLVNFMIKNKDNSLYYTGRGITSIRNIYNYWNYAHSHSTAYIPNFNTMYLVYSDNQCETVDNKVNNYYININFL